VPGMLVDVVMKEVGPELVDIEKTKKSGGGWGLCIQG
jgi:hypothetical protein